MGGDNSTDDINRTIRLRRASFGELNFMLKNHVVWYLYFASLTCDCGPLTRVILIKWRKPNEAMERAMLGIWLKDRHTNANIRRITKIINLSA